MKKQAKWSQFLAVVVAATAAAVALPETGFSDDGANAAGSASVTTTEVLTRLHPSMVSDGETFEYQLLPFHRTNFGNRQEFEDWLDDLGASGWFSIFHFGAFNPQAEQRLFMRPVGGDSLEVDFDIEQNTQAFSNNVEVWVTEFDRLGEMGKIPVALFTEGGATYAVTEAYTRDGELRTWSYRKELAGKRHQVTPARFKRRVKKLAKDDYVPLAIGFPDESDQADYYVVGIKETTQGGVRTVKLKFGVAKLSTSPSEWKKLINRKAKKGFQLVEVELADNSGTNFILVFARVKINGKITRRKCVVEPILLSNLVRMTGRLNSRGAAGYEKILETFAGGVNSFQFVLGMDK